MPDITNSDTPITADGTYTCKIGRGNKARVSVRNISGTGTITVADKFGVPYRNEANDADITFTATSTIPAFDITTDGVISLIATAVTSGSGNFTYDIIDLGRG